MSGTDPRRDVLDRYFAGINSERFDQVGALFAADAVLQAPGFGSIHGPEAIVAYLQRALAAYPEHHDEPTRFLPAPEAMTVEIHFRGALRNGTPFEFEAVDIFDFAADGSIARLTTWYDSNAILGKLAKAAAADPPGDDAVGRGSAAEATPARTRSSLRAVRSGHSVAIGGGWREARQADAPPLVTRAVLLEAAGVERLDAEGLAASAAVAEVELRPGDALLVRTGLPRVAIDSVPRAVSAIGVDAEVSRAPRDLLAGGGWDVTAARAGVPAAGRPVALLVAGSSGAPTLIF